MLKNEIVENKEKSTTIDYQSITNNNGDLILKSGEIVDRIPIPKNKKFTNLLESQKSEVSKLTVIEFAGIIKRTNNQYYWICLCSCGVTVIINHTHLRKNTVLSCGCLQRKNTGDANRKHGMCDSPEYIAWLGMKARCNNNLNPQYKDWGGRGIVYFQEWENFEPFIEYMKNHPKDGKRYSIERIDNNGNYEPGNVRWATYKEQANNTRKNRIVIFNGQEMTATQLAEKVGMDVACLYARLKKYDVDTAVNLPYRKNRPIVQLDKNTNEFISYFVTTNEAATKFGIRPNNIYFCMNDTTNSKSCGGYKWMWREDYEKDLEIEK